MSNGGNILRRGKTLKLRPLERNGVGRARGHCRELLPENRPDGRYWTVLRRGWSGSLVGDWVWQQAPETTGPLESPKA